MEAVSIFEEETRDESPVTADIIRDQIIEYAKDFKTSWVKLGQTLYPVWKDKLFYAWGFDKFEYYTERELGMKKPMALKLVKAYFFLEQEEPAYLSEKFSEDRDAVKVPGCDAINVLRMARGKKELTRDDYDHLKQMVFEKGKDASLVRKDLTALMKERKEVDPDEEREQRNIVAIRKVVNAMRSFKKDMDALKLLRADLVEEADALLKKLEDEMDLGVAP